MGAAAIHALRQEAQAVSAALCARPDARARAANKHCNNNNNEETAAAWSWHVTCVFFILCVVY